MSVLGGHGLSGLDPGHDCIHSADRSQLVLETVLTRVASAKSAGSRKAT